MFTGVFQHAIDAKGRTSLPSSFRERLAAQSADRLFVTSSPLEPCLMAYAPADWTRVLEKVASMNTFAQETRSLVRAFISPAQECAVDKLGRILIPQSLRDYAGLGEEITWAGATTRIEVWSPARWAELQQKFRAPEVQADLQSSLGKLPI